MLNVYDLCMSMIRGNLHAVGKAWEASMLIRFRLETRIHELLKLDIKYTWNDSLIII